MSARNRLILSFMSALFLIGLFPLAAYAQDMQSTGQSPVTQGSTTTSWTRLWGPIALDTMESIVDTGFGSNSCDTVVIATAGGYWDALTATGIAGLNGCPVLLTDGSSLSAQTSAEITRLGAKKAYIAGGTAAVSSDVEDQIQVLGLTTTRMAGATAVYTALEIYEQGKGSWGKTAIVATSDGYWDALSASPYAYAKNAPVFLTNASTRTLDSDVVTAIETGGFSQVMICGGTAAVSSEVEKQLSSLSCTRLGGATAYETSTDIAEYCLTQGMVADGMGVATGDGYWDALSGASLCGKNGSVLVLVTDCNRSAIASFIIPHENAITKGYVFGGTAAVSAETYQRLSLDWTDGNTSVPSTATVGSAVTFSTTVSGNTSGLTYDHLWRYGDSGSWNSAGSSTATSGSFTPTQVGTYQVCVKTQDTLGNTLTSPAASVTVYPYDRVSATQTAKNGTTQIILVETADSDATSATVSLHTKDSNGVWVENYSTDGYVGSDGVGSASEDSSRTPAGSYDLPFAFGNRSNPGTNITWHDVTDKSTWVDDSGSGYYNTWQENTSLSGEHLADFTKAYAYAAVIGYNYPGYLGTMRSGCVARAGSAFFLHCSTYGPTAGCVSIPENYMVAFLQSMHSDCRIVIGTLADIDNY